MKTIKLFFIFLLLPFCVVAQTNVSYDYANQINAALQKTSMYLI